MLATTVLAADYAGTLDISGTARLAPRASQPTTVVPLTFVGLGSDFAMDFSLRRRLSSA